jgi:hypothetical protein
MSLTGIRASGTRHAAASRRTSSNKPSQLAHGILQAKACVTSLIDAARLQTERVSNEAVIAAKASYTSSSRPNTLVAQIEAARLAAREKRGSKARAARGGEGEGQRVIVLWAADEDTIAGSFLSRLAGPSPFFPPPFSAFFFVSFHSLPISSNHILYIFIFVAFVHR